MSETTVLTEKDYAFGRTTWMQLASKWGHLPDSERISYQWTNSEFIPKSLIFKTTVGEIKARAFDSITSRLPKHGRDAYNHLQGVRYSGMFPATTNPNAAKDIEPLYDYLINALPSTQAELEGGQNGNS